MSEDLAQELDHRLVEANKAAHRVARAKLAWRRAATGHRPITELIALDEQFYKALDAYELLLPASLEEG